MAKNFNLKVKNSQLAAMLKQKGVKSGKKPAPSKIDNEKKIEHVYTDGGFLGGGEFALIKKTTNIRPVVSRKYKRF